MTALLISGEIATGKTAVAVQLADVTVARLVKVREALGEVLGIDARDRLTLQVQGADLDRRTNGRWLRDYIRDRHEPNAQLVIDALRTRRQTVPILEGIVDSRLIYLEAHEETRRHRYAEAAATDPVKASLDFDTAMHHPTETEVRLLRPMAHLVIATDDLSVAAVVSEIVSTLGLQAGSQKSSGSATSEPGTV